MTQKSKQKTNGATNNRPKTIITGKASRKGLKNTKDTQNTGPDNWDLSKEKLVYYAFVLFLAGVAGVLHNAHVSKMFENQTFFSHLSTLERELSFRTEMGLYYSYYKTVVEAPSLLNGINSIVNCNITEYPSTVNVLRRFNLYPELVLGTLYRWYDAVTKSMNMKTKDCYQINRGKDLSPVMSCIGMGELSFFYVYPIFWLNGLMVSLLFILCCYLSNSVFGGIIGVASYFYNHGECTRVMWTAPLRESFSFPFLIAQLLSVVYVIKTRKPSKYHSIILAATTCCFMLPWQFAQFALLTQTCALFGLYILKFIDSQRFLIILYGLMASHLMNFVLQFGNTLLLSSLFLSAMIASMVVINLEHFYENLPNRILIWISQGVTFLVVTFGSKLAIAKSFNIKDDAHIFDILKSKFSDYKDFHTLLYTCAPEFDFLPLETPIKLSKTLALPCAAVVTGTLIFKILSNEYESYTNQQQEENETNDETQKEYCPTKPHTAQFFMLLQAIAFIMMSLIIMRLKLFGSPSVCIMASMIASRQLFGFIGKKSQHYAIVVLILALMSVQGFANIKQQFNVKGEYSNTAMEQLMEWINANTNKDAVFAGSMPTMATVKLTTGRPIVNHPHYEDAGLRERTKTIYQVFSRKPVSDVYDALKSLHVQYFILEDAWCGERSGRGCALPEVWDLEDPDNRSNRPACKLIPEKPSPFSIVFKRPGHSGPYAILQWDFQDDFRFARNTEI